MMDGIAIRCRGLSRTYGKVQALQDLDLDVPAGTVFGFLGRNGAGKTTTIRLLTGLAHPTAGSAWVSGVETTNGESVARQLFGYLPQEPAFYNWMTPQEYLTYVGRLAGMQSETLKQRVPELLELVSLQDAAKRRIGGFSGGMLQRLGIAQALVHQPPVLLLDEPTSALDPAGRHEVLALIERLSSEVTVFFSTHILSDVERICDWVAIIHRGRLVRVSERDVLMEQYQTNAVELDFDSRSLPLPPEFLSELEGQPWAASLTQDQDRLRLAVSDIEAGKRQLLPLVLRYGLVLDSHAWVRPSLEEIFLEISSE